MASVQFDFTARRCSLKVQGHASGSVQVCAAVSMLCFSLAAYLRQLQREGRAQPELLRLRSGDALLCARGEGEVQAAFRLVYQGFALLAERFPQQVTMEKII